MPIFNVQGSKIALLGLLGIRRNSKKDRHKVAIINLETYGIPEFSAIQ